MQSLKQILENSPRETCSAHPAMQRTNNQTNTPEKTLSNLDNINNEKKRIDLLFSKFAAFYGHVWRSQFKDEGFLVFAKKEWREALIEFTDDVLTQAILICREFYELPPTLPQLILCCRQIKKQLTFNIKQSDPAPVNREAAAFYLKKCKEMLAT